MRVCLISVVLAASGVASPALSDALPGPISATVQRVVDGDTLEVRARIWINQDITVLVRLDGIDAPELRGSDCPSERERARAARDFAARWSAEAGSTVTLTNVRQGKWAGRVVADVVDPSRDDIDADLAAALVDAGLATPGARRVDEAWCPLVMDVTADG